MKNTKELALAKTPRIAARFQTWQVYVPEGQEFDLRLGIGNASDKDIPPTVGSVRIPPGQHRVTLYSGDSIIEKFQYLVYLDGLKVIEKTMGSDWMPDGWSSASGIAWPTRLAILHLHCNLPRKDTNRIATLERAAISMVRTIVKSRDWVIDFGSTNPIAPTHQLHHSLDFQVIHSTWDRPTRRTKVCSIALFSMDIHPTAVSRY